MAATIKPLAASAPSPLPLVEEGLTARMTRRSPPLGDMAVSSVVVAVLLAGFAVLTVPSAAFSFGWTALQPPTSQQLWHVAAERNVWTWANVAVLMTGANLHLAMGYLAWRRSERWWFRWLASGAALGALSLDDLASLHERLSGLGRAMGGGEGFLYYAWVLPGALLGAVLVGAFAMHFLRSDRSVRLLLGVGLGLFLGGALGLEMVNAQASYASGAAKTAFEHTFTLLEEYAEAAGAALLLAAAIAALPPGWRRLRDWARPEA